MQADNDNLDGCVSGFETWEPLGEVSRKVVEACARKRAASHQVDGRESWPWGNTDGAHRTRPSCIMLVSSR